MFMFMFRSSTGLNVSVDFRPKTIRKAMKGQLLEKSPPYKREGGGWSRGSSRTLRVESQ